MSAKTIKRTEIRIPQARYEAVKEFAKQNSQSLNQSMIELMRTGLNHEKEGGQAVSTIGLYGVDEIADKIASRILKIMAAENNQEKGREMGT